MNSSSARKIVEKSQEIIWFVARGAVLKGPYTSGQIDQLLESKEILHNDFCWRQGFREWRPISSVEDFDRRANLTLLPAYPSVEVPSGPGVSASPSTAWSGRVERSSTQPKRVEVQFAKSKRFSISIYEYGAAAILAVIFAYFSSQFAMKEVAKQITLKIELMTLGAPTTWGQVDDGLSYALAEPLFSAPSLETQAKLGSVAFWAWQDLGRPVELRGQWPVQSSYKPVGFSESLETVDPVYRRPVLIKGDLALGPQGGLQPRLPGDPFLP
jgi:hypothetical protein